MAETLTRAAIESMARYLGSWHRDFGLPDAGEELLAHDAAQRAETASLKALLREVVAGR